MDEARKMGLVFLAVWLLLRVGASAQMSDDMEGIEGGLKLKVDAELRVALDKLLDEEHFAKELFIEWPIATPKKNSKALRADIKAAIEKDVKEKYPNTLLSSYIAELQEKYKPVREGDRVTVELRSGQRLAGQLREMKRYTFKLDNREVRKDELAEDSLLYFRPDLAGERILALTRAKQAELGKKRREYAARRQEPTEREFFTADNYIQILGKWIPKEQYFEKELRAYRETLAKKLRPMLKLKVYDEAGFTMFEGKWMTKEHAAKQRRLIAEARAAEAAEQQKAEETPATPEPTPAEEEDEDDGGGLWD